jgi:hypothetical protein
VRDCTVCGGLLRLRATWARDGIVHRIFAHKATDGNIHSLTEGQIDPDAPDTELPVAVGIWPEVSLRHRERREQKARLRHTER